MNKALERIQHEALIKPENQQAVPIIVPFAHYIESRERTLLHADELPFYLLMPEVEQLLEATLNDHHRLLWDFIWHTGARISEALEVRPKDLILDGQITSSVSLINLKRGKKKKKEKPRRLVPITDISFIHALKRYIKTHGIKKSARLFDITRKTAYATMKRNAKAAGLPENVTPHTLRHSYAVNLLLHGLQITLIKDHLGHERLESTEIYLQVLGRDTAHLVMHVQYKQPLVSYSTGELINE
jgi:site-specific recombinase XerD